MKELVKNFILVLILILSSFFIMLYFCLPTSEEDLVGGGQAAIISFDDIQNDIVERYPNGKIVETTTKYIPATNLKQSMLNQHYNESHKTDYNNTCGEVAVATVVLNYLNKTRNMSIKDSNKCLVFDKVMNLAIENDYFPQQKNGYTKSKNVVKILNKTLAYYNINKRGHEVFGSLYSNAKEISDKNEMAIISVSGHFMVTAGYYEVKVQTTETTGWWFFEKTQTVIKTIKYFVVLNGWTNGDTLGDVVYYLDKQITYSFYPADKIGENIITDFLQVNNYFLIELK